MEEVKSFADTRKIHSGVAQSFLISLGIIAMSDKLLLIKD